MTPKEKAEQLVTDMFNRQTPPCSFKEAMQCALIAVDEIENECGYWTGGTNVGWDIQRFDYWEQVKKEITLCQ